MCPSCFRWHTDGMALATAQQPDLDVSTTLTARAAALVAVLLALAATMSLPIDGLESVGDAGLRLVSGTLEQRVDGDWLSVAPGTDIAAGTWIRTTDRVAELGRPGVAVHMREDTELVVEDVVDLQRGSLLMGSEREVSATTGLITVAGRGWWRLDAGQSARAGTYAGTATVRDGAGREELLRDYRQVAIVAGVIEGAPAPLTYVATDAFDRRFLADALTIDDFLAALGRGLRADYGTEPQQLAFYQDFDGLGGQVVHALAALADGSLEEVSSDGRIGPPDRLLVAAVVSEAVALAAGLPPAEAAEAVRTERLAGAAWGLIAVTFDVSPGDIRTAADRALTQRREAAARGEAVPVDRAPPDDATPGDQGQGPDPEQPPPPDPGEDPTPPDDDDDGIVGEEVDPIVDELPDEVQDPVDEAVDIVDELIDGPLDLLTGGLVGD